MSTEDKSAEENKVKFESVEYGDDKITPVATPVTPAPDPDPVIDLQEPAVTPVIDPELTEEAVLSFFEKKGRKVESIESLFIEPEPKVVEKAMELPENVKAFHEFHKQTGRSIEDFVNLNRDFSKMPQNQVLAEYYALENPAWSKEQIQEHIDDSYSYDPDMLDEREIKRIERLKASEVNKAIGALDSMKEKYAAPLASIAADLSDDEKAEMEEFRLQKQQADLDEDTEAERSKVFVEKTNELFSPTFEGFGFNVGEEGSLLYKPDEPGKLAKDQMRLSEWLNGFKDEKGFIKDAEAFHRSIAVARNPDAFAKHFYEQGKADQVVAFEKESRNIDMTRNQPQVVAKNGLKMEIVDHNGPTEFKIRSNKNKT